MSWPEPHRLRFELVFFESPMFNLDGIKETKFVLYRTLLARTCDSLNVKRNGMFLLCSSHKTTDWVKRFPLFLLFLCKGFWPLKIRILLSNFLSSKTREGIRRFLKTKPANKSNLAVGLPWVVRRKELVLVAATGNCCHFEMRLGSRVNWLG